MVTNRQGKCRDQSVTIYGNQIVGISIALFMSNVYWLSHKRDQGEASSLRRICIRGS